MILILLCQLRQVWKVFPAKVVTTVIGKLLNLADRVWKRFQKFCIIWDPLKKLLLPKLISFLESFEQKSPSKDTNTFNFLCGGIDVYFWVRWNPCRQSPANIDGGYTSLLCLVIDTCNPPTQVLALTSNHSYRQDIAVGRMMAAQLGVRRCEGLAAESPHSIAGPGRKYWRLSPLPGTRICLVRSPGSSGGPSSVPGRLTQCRLGGGAGLAYCDQAVEWATGWDTGRRATFCSVANTAVRRTSRTC